MKKLQNPRIMDDDRIDMKSIEHQGEDEDVTTVEKILIRKQNNKGSKKCWWEAMATHELLAKIFFEVHLKKIGNFVFPDRLNFWSNCGEWFKAI